MNFFKSKLKICIEGLNLHHVINFFEHKNFNIENLNKITNKKITCIISKKDFKNLKKSSLYNNYNITILTTYGYINLIKLLVSNLGIIIGVISCLFATVSFTSKIHSIQIINHNHTCNNGNDCIFTNENKNLVLKCLSSNGIKLNSNINNIPESRLIERILMNDFPQISGVSITRNGINLYVEIIEGSIKDKKQSPLIAESSGVLINLSVTSGKCNSKIGDVIIKGDTIITPEDNKPIVASVTLRTFNHESMIYNEENTKYVKTGKKINVNNLSLFGLHLNSNIQPSFKLYESLTTTKYTALNMFLPIKITSTTFYELKEVVSVIPFETVEYELKENLKRNILKSINTSNHEIKNITYQIYKEGSRTRLDCYVESYYKIEKKG